MVPSCSAITKHRLSHIVVFSHCCPRRKTARFSSVPGIAVLENNSLVIVLQLQLQPRVPATLGRAVGSLRSDPHVEAGGRRREGLAVFFTLSIACFEIKGRGQTTPCSRVRASPRSSFSFERTEHLDGTPADMLDLLSAAFAARVGLADVIVGGCVSYRACLIF